MSGDAEGHELVCPCVRKPRLHCLVTGYYCILLCLVSVLCWAMGIKAKL